MATETRNGFTWVHGYDQSETERGGLVGRVYETEAGCDFDWSVFDSEGRELACGSGGPDLSGTMTVVEALLPAMAANTAASRR